MPKDLSVLSDKEILRFAQNDFLFGTEIFAKYFPYFSPRNFFSVINVTGDVNIKPSKADTATKQYRKSCSSAAKGNWSRLALSRSCFRHRQPFRNVDWRQSVMVMRKGCQSVTVFISLRCSTFSAQQMCTLSGNCTPGITAQPASGS